MDETLITVKEVALNNNCPECYGRGGLILTFKQKVIENQLYKSITSEIKESIHCKTCNNIVYPEQWTDDIDRIVEYQQKAFKALASSTYIKKTSWIIIALVSIVILGTILLVAFV
ncbi:hypothetical protein [Confluentibacter flavum]|uniref:Uncharacterized protein n=1 Tax=Confluentibacter flavum TaxID=1909700 RepID=A0A2N3HI66_9FLAO|nr:hypothetical protein [Confluentibacter flavum]PKQ44657.1 hypothetical protein CSW08_11765 [Confluentibacter flavum]